MGLLDNALGNSYSNPWGQNDPTKVGQGSNGSNGVQGPQPASTTPGGLDATKGSILADAQKADAAAGQALTGDAAHRALGAQTDDGKNGQAIVADANKRMGVTVSPIGQVKQVDPDAKPKVETGYDKDGNLMKVTTDRQTGVKSFETTDANGRKLSDSTENAKTGEKTLTQYGYKADGSVDMVINTKTDANGNSVQESKDGKGNLMSVSTKTKNADGTFSTEDKGYKDGKVNETIIGKEDDKGNRTQKTFDANMHLTSTADIKKNDDGSTTTLVDGYENGKKTVSVNERENKDGSISKARVTYGQDGKETGSSLVTRDKDGNYSKQVADANGNMTRMTKDAHGRITSNYKESKNADGTTSFQDGNYKNGKLVSVNKGTMDDKGNSSFSTIDPATKQVKSRTEIKTKEDGSKESVSVNYDKDGNKSDVVKTTVNKDGTSRSTAVNYEKDGKTIRSTIVTDKDKDGKETSDVMKDGKIVAHSTKSTDKDGVTTSTMETTNKDGNKTTSDRKENPDGTFTENNVVYEKDGKTVKSTEQVTKDKEGTVVKETKDENGTKKEETKKDGSSTVTQTATDGSSVTTTSNAAGKTTVVKDKDGKVLSTKSEPAPKVAVEAESKDEKPSQAEQNKADMKNDGDSAFQAMNMLNKVLQDSGRIKKPGAPQTQAPAWNFKRHDK